MPRSNWKGVISFGLVTIPIVLYPSENKKAHISFHQIDKRDNARIKYQRINSETGKEVEWKDITRGYEYDKETTIPVPDEVLKKVGGVEARDIDIQNFVAKESIDMLTLENVYYLVPDKNGQKGYVILRDALADTNKAGIAKVIISTKEYLAAVMAHENALVLCLLKYDDEVHKLSEYDLPEENLKKYKVTNKEIEVAKKLIASMTTKWKPEKYKDEYQSILHEWAEETVKNIPHKRKEKSIRTPANGKANLIDLLKRSLAATGNGKSKAKSKKPKIIKRKGKHATHCRALH